MRLMGGEKWNLKIGWPPIQVADGRLVPNTGGRWEVGPQNRWEVEAAATPPSFWVTSRLAYL